MLTASTEVAKDTKSSIAFHVLQGTKTSEEEMIQFLSFIQHSFYKRILFPTSFPLSPYWFNNMDRNGYNSDFINSRKDSNNDLVSPF